MLEVVITTIKASIGKKKKTASFLFIRTSENYIIDYLIHAFARLTIVAAVILTRGKSFNLRTEKQEWKPSLPQLRGIKSV